MAMGKRAATEVLEAGGVTWEQLCALLDTADVTDDPSRRNKAVTVRYSRDLFAAGIEDRAGEVKVWRTRYGRRSERLIHTGEFLIARNILREFGPLGGE